jgi:hypothetical protein
MISTPKMLFVAIVAFIFGGVMFISWVPRLLVARSPVVLGHVTARVPISEWGVPRADYTIAIEGTSEVVHAHTQRYLLERVPDEVRFHYSGDPARLVYLFEHEENPLWIGLFCWAAAAVLGAMVYVQWSSCRSAGRSTD